MPVEADDSGVITQVTPGGSQNRRAERVDEFAGMHVPAPAERLGNVVPHLHWHIAPLPPGTPYRRQQFQSLMFENGVLPWSAEEAAALAARLRAGLGP